MVKDRAIIAIGNKKSHVCFQLADFSLTLACSTGQLDSWNSVSQNMFAFLFGFMGFFFKYIQICLKLGEFSTMFVFWNSLSSSLVLEWFNPGQCIFIPILVQSPMLRKCGHSIVLIDHGDILSILFLIKTTKSM